MKDQICGEFQDTVAGCLIRHKSIIDVVSKMHETTSRVSRALCKAVTSCGCLKINAKKQQIPGEIRLHELGSYMETHVEGELCNECREFVEQELGNHLFYIAALCNILDINLSDVICAETDKLSTLGIYHMS